MGHINYRRRIKVRKPILLKPNKIIIPKNIYHKPKYKKRWLEGEDL